MKLLDQVENSLAPKHISIIEFAESSDYCGKTLYPRQAVLLKLLNLEELTGEEEDVLDYWLKGGRNGTEIEISPNVRERVEWLRENDYPHFREAILVGGRRSSKGFCTGIQMAYVMWNCLQLQDPGAYYGIDPEKEIYFSCVAGSEEQAKEFQYADFSSTVTTCKSFDPYIIKSLETELRIATETDLRRIHTEKAKGNRIQKDIARLRGKALAANAGTLRGSATMAICIDEMAHMIPGESKAAADQVYNAADPSLDQFGVDGMMFCNSSPYSKVGMFFDRFEAAKVKFDPDRPLDDVVVVGEEGDIDIHELNGDPRIFTLQFASWSLFEGYQKSKHAKRLKWTLMACPEWDEDEKNEDGTPYWNDKDITAIKAARSKEKQNPETYKVERRGKFAEVTEAYIPGGVVDKMFAGLPIEWVSKMNPRTHEQGPLEPVYAELATNDMGRVGEYGRHKFHIDPSSTTAGFGFAIAHPENIVNGATMVEEEHVVFDVIQRWQPQHFAGKVIDWHIVLPELVGFAELFRPFEITFGQHESLQAMQELDEKLRQKNYGTRIFQPKETAELNWKRWEVTKTSMYSGYVHAPKDTEDAKFAALELKFLQKQAGAGRWPRIDKQEMGPVQTKDMADCIAECVSTLIGNQIANRTRDRLTHSALLGGSPGGYQIGLGSNPAVGGAGPPNISEYYSRRDEKIGGGGNPARGVLGGGRNRRNRNKARW
jgi:hypothetical protein